jgi:hypothetical protein
MPPKKKQLKGGLFDPASMNMTLMTAPKISMLDAPNSNYSSKNYLNVQNGGGKQPKKQTKSTPSATGGGKKTNKKPKK